MIACSTFNLLTNITHKKQQNLFKPQVIVFRSVIKSCSKNSCGVEGLPYSCSLTTLDSQFVPIILMCEDNTEN